MTEPTANRIDQELSRSTADEPEPDPEGQGVPSGVFGGLAATSKNSPISSENSDGTARDAVGVSGRGVDGGGLVSESATSEGGCPVHIDLRLEVNDTTPPLTGWLDAALERVCSCLGLDGGWVNLLVVGDEPMARWHQQHKHQPGTTDVLTFDLRGDPSQGDVAVAGDVVVCLDEAVRQASGCGHGVRQELLLYAVHGLLHLIGYDDRDPASAEAMHRKEDELLIAAGFGPIYSHGGHGASGG